MKPIQSGFITIGCDSIKILPPCCQLRGLQRIPMPPAPANHTFEWKNLRAHCLCLLKCGCLCLKPGCLDLLITYLNHIES